MSLMDGLMERPHKMMVFSYEKVPIEVVKGGDYELTKEGNMGIPRCHRMAYSGQHQCWADLFLDFQY